MLKTVWWLLPLIYFHHPDQPVCKSGAKTSLSQALTKIRILFHNTNRHNNLLSVGPHLCCISSGSFCFRLWSTGDWELMLRDGGVPSLICSLPPSGSVLPRSVFLHFALRFWNQTCIKKKERKKGNKINNWELNFLTHHTVCIHLFLFVKCRFFISFVISLTNLDAHICLYQGNVHVLWRGQTKA